MIPLNSMDTGKCVLGDGNKKVLSLKLIKDERSKLPLKD